MSQRACAQIRLAAVGVYHRTIIGLGHCVDGQVAAQQVFFEGDVGRELGDEAAITGAGLAFASRQRMFGMGVWMQKYREIPADGAIAQVEHLLRSSAGDHVIALCDFASEQCVAHCATD